MNWFEVNIRRLGVPSEVKSDSDFNWVHLHTENLHLVDSTTLLPSSNMTISEDARMYRLSSRGLSVFATLWEVVDFVDLEPIRQKYAGDWKLVKQPGTSNQDRRQATTDIFFEVIMLLKSRGMIQAADAVLNSVSDPLWRSQDRHTGSDVVESVLQIPSVPATESQNMFVFSWVIGGMPHQSWLIDRIMNKGGIWLAKPVDCYGLPFGADVDAVSTSKHNSPSTVSRALDLYSNMVLHGAGEEGASMHTWMHHIFEASAHLADETHCGRLFQVSLFTKLIAKWLGDSMNPSEPTDNRASVDRIATANASGETSKLDSMLSSIIPLAQWSRLLTGQVDRSEFLDRRAIFDIEGSDMTGSFVLTPFQAQLESVPRPRARNLSVSWTVRSVENDEISGTKDSEKKFRVTGMVRGMWKYTFLNSGRFTLV